MNEKVLPLYEFEAVEDPIEEEMKLEDGKEIVEEARDEMQVQLKEVGEKMQLSYPYYTDVLETGVSYETTGWLIIYGIEILEGEGEAVLSFIWQDLVKLEGVNKERRNFITPKAIIVPELTNFALNAKTKMKYRLVGEGNNNPKIEVYVEKTYIRTHKMIDDDKGKVHVEESECT